MTSWYKDGNYRCYPSDNIVNVGWYDTYTQGSGDGFKGDWGVFPYLPSGILVVSDINNGLFVLEPTYQRACYLEGVVTDSITGSPIFNATIQILNTNITKNSKANGEYKTGTVNAGTYDIQVSAAGYVTKVITGISLSSGVVTTLDVALAPLASTSLTGQVIEIATSNPIPNANVTFSGNGLEYSTTADASGNFTIPSMVLGSYNVTAGKWGYRTQCTTIGIQANPSPVIIALDKGYYDDFSFDFGWTISGSSANLWERGVPHGTPAVFGPGYANPNEDDQTDCLDQAYVTDNNPNASSSGSNDVDNGTAILTSPVFDFNRAINPTITFYRWFYNDGGNGNPNDSLIIKNKQWFNHFCYLKQQQPTLLEWVHGLIKLFPGGLIPLTANMTLTVYTADQFNSGHVVEAGFDKFEIIAASGINTIETDNISLTASPNPFNDVIQIHYKSKDATANTITVTDIAGRIVKQTGILPASGSVTLGIEFSSGVYFVRLNESGKCVKSIKVVKN